MHHRGQIYVERKEPVSESGLAFGTSQYCRCNIYEYPADCLVNPSLHKACTGGKGGERRRGSACTLVRRNDAASRGSKKNHPSNLSRDPPLPSPSILSLQNDRDPIPSPETKKERDRERENSRSDRTRLRQCCAHTIKRPAEIEN